MKSDLTPIIFDVPYGVDIVIHPISDLHYGSPQFREKEWKYFIDTYANLPNHYFVIVGDMMNNGLKNSVTNVYEETCRPREQKKWLVEQLAPIKDKIICGVGGNHERRSLKDSDDDPLYDVFAKLDIEDRYRENISFCFVRFGGADYRDKAGKLRPTYTIAVTHGAGGGKLIGSSANNAERFGSIIDGLDCIIVGHTHKPLTFPSAKLYVDVHNKQIKLKQFTVVTATSWLDYGGYPVQKMLTPTAFAPNQIWLASKNKMIKVLQ